MRGATETLVADLHTPVCGRRTTAVAAGSDVKLPLTQLSRHLRRLSLSLLNSVAERLARGTRRASPAGWLGGG